MMNSYIPLCLIALVAIIQTMPTIDDSTNNNNIDYICKIIHNIIIKKESPVILNISLMVQYIVLKQLVFFIDSVYVIINVSLNMMVIFN